MKPLTALEVLQNFDSLPDDAVVRRRVTAIVLGMCERTLRRTSPIKTVQITERIAGHRVGDIRKLIRGESAVAF
jgi:hypothetical protein